MNTVEQIEAVDETLLYWEKNLMNTVEQLETVDRAVLYEIKNLQNTVAHAGRNINWRSTDGR